MSRPQHFAWFLSRGFGPQAWGQPGWEWDHSWTAAEGLPAQRPRARAGRLRPRHHRGRALARERRHPRPPDPPRLRRTQARPAAARAVALRGHAAPRRRADRESDGLQPVSGGAPVRHAAAPQRRPARLNVVTDVGSSRHFGFEPLPHDGAYDRAHEWLDSLRELWRSWDDGALIQDEATGRFADGDRLHALQHRGTHYSFDGPLNALPFGAGSSTGPPPAPASRSSSRPAARRAASTSPARSPRSSWPSPRSTPRRSAPIASGARAAAAAHGRNPDDLTILFVFKPIIVSSREEAQRLVDASAHPDDAALLTAAAAWSSDLETDLTALDLDRRSTRRSSASTSRAAASPASTAVPTKTPRCAPCSPRRPGSA